MNKIVKRALAALSRYDVDLKNHYEETRQFERATRPYYNRITTNMMERELRLDGRTLLTRAFSRDGKIAPVIVYFHGGGFVTGDFDSYSHVCAHLAAQTGYKVVAVDYRLAPEHKFPAGPEDCYDAMQTILQHCTDWYQTDPGEIVVMGDSAGGTLSCVTSMMARDRGGLLPKKQILVYPAAWCDYREHTPFASVLENGEEYLLTAKKLQDYMELYISDESDYENPYFAPLRHTDFSGLPDTLILTMEFDPLRDEGEALARSLMEGGTNVVIRRIRNGIHGMLSLPPATPITRQLYKHIIEFLPGVIHGERNEAKLSER
ncbi:MAG: alpha/beta hydrolase [Clostridia bacterium]|nr:alpha/beta hydrolase [Clostridia bacterium]